MQYTWTQYRLLACQQRWGDVIELFECTKTEYQTSPQLLIVLLRDFDAPVFVSTLIVFVLIFGNVDRHSHQS
jgi:hypothetical protein